MYKTIVAATDGTDASDRALAVATDLATAFRARLVVVHVNELVVVRGGAIPLDPSETETDEKIRNQVRNLARDGRQAELKIHTARDPARSIANEANAVGADLIVTGASRHGPVAGMLLGSVAHRLLHIASCPVMAVPMPERHPLIPLFKTA